MSDGSIKASQDDSSASLIKETPGSRDEDVEAIVGSMGREEGVLVRMVNVELEEERMNCNVREELGQEG